MVKTRMEVRVLKAVPRPVLPVAPYPKIKRCRKCVLLRSVPSRVAGSNPALLRKLQVAQLVEQGTARCMSRIAFYPFPLFERCRTNVLLLLVETVQTVRFESCFTHPVCYSFDFIILFGV